MDMAATAFLCLVTHTPSWHNTGAVYLIGFHPKDNTTVNIKVLTRAANPGQIFALAPENCIQNGFHTFAGTFRLRLPVGSILNDSDGVAIFTVFGHAWLDCQTSCGPRAILCPLVQNIRPTDKSEMILDAIFRPWTVAIVSLSDKGSIGQRDDRSGAAILEMVKGAISVSLLRNFILEDDENLLMALLSRLAHEDMYDLIITTGGTGVGPRDVTPQATSRIIDTPLPGYVAAMMNSSLTKTPHAAISRSVAGIAGQSLIINLPGSLKAVQENLSAVLGAIPHTLLKLHGDTEDCGA